LGFLFVYLVMGTNKGNNEQHILDVIERSRRNEASAQDLQELDQWYDSFQGSPLYTDGMSVNEEEEAMQMLLNRIHEVIEPELKPILRYRPWYASKWVVAVAASMLLISGMAALFYLRTDQMDLSNSISSASNILPGTNSATLTLADGKKIKLAESANGDLAKEAGVLIVKTADGKLVYQVQNSAAEAGQVNTISTAIGETYQVRFSDGTAVWLNAASTLKFPAKFSKLSARIVELNGEAYFEVAKDKAHPFIVKSRDQQVKVLGTHFNINSYADEQNVATTLLEGAVQVSLSNPMKTNTSLKSVLLKPGQQSLLSGTSLSVAQVQTDDVIAWKNGNFMFNNESMEIVMCKLSRWYNIEVKYADPGVKQIKFFGTVSRFSNVSKVLEMIALTNEVKFEVKGKEITVLRN
jgi:transmembrane sensor